MHQMIKSQGLRRFLVKEAPSGLLALLIAELFYKFHSFVLECIGFLATWYVLSLIVDVVTHAFRRDSAGVRTNPSEPG